MDDLSMTMDTLAVHAGRSITEGPVRLATTLVVRDSTAAPLEVGAASAR